MRNILFVLYYDFTANSAIHVHNFANQLASFGHGVAVAVPANKDTGANLGEQSYVSAEFSEIDGEWDRLFRDGRPPDIVHAWTPREAVRLFCDKLLGLCTFALVVHLEDNEERILEVNLGASFEKLRTMASLEVPMELSHPHRYRQFLRSASAVTMIMDRLAEFVPPHTPQLILWPGADFSLFSPQPKSSDFLAGLGIAADNLVFCYTGNVHSSNAREVRSLYLAVAMLNREGCPATLVRAGADHCPFLGDNDEWARRHSIELGYVKHVDIARILNAADILIQPGAADPFNDFRLPAKLPEFFAMGRPVILPATNLGRFVQHREHAWVLPNVNALGIVQAVQQLRQDGELTARLSRGSLEFAKQYFDWGANARKLESFYATVCARDNKNHPAATAVIPT
jgi:glycosyltransferase involved in cell wall biosynthesis